MSSLQLAIEIAKEAHYGYTDKGGNDYFLHPERVMNNLKSTVEKIVGVLHDVIEDNKNFTFEYLRKKGFGDDVLVPLDNVTRREGETYDEFLYRVKQHPVSIAVKIEDILDNCDLTRIPNITKQDRRRVKRYQRALEILTTDNYEFKKTENGMKWVKKSV